MNLNPDHNYFFYKSDEETCVYCKFCCAKIPHTHTPPTLKTLCLGLIAIKLHNKGGMLYPNIKREMPEHLCKSLVYDLLDMRQRIRLIIYLKLRSIPRLNRCTIRICRLSYVTILKTGIVKKRYQVQFNTKFYTFCMHGDVPAMTALPRN